MERDEWRRDPSVQGMRRIFAGAEAGQERLLEQLNISRFDARLREWRKIALHLFEEHWARTARQGIGLTEKDAGDLYVYCLAKALKTRGIVVPAALFPDNAAVQALLQEKK